ncbi:MAG: cytochrome c [Chloroflexi bacterium]|nr:cytochrome c [Chloroflexota bacterium]
MMRLLIGACMASALLLSCTEAPASEPVARGRQVYRALDCGRCHQIAGEGARLGPELTNIGTVAAARVPGVTAEEYLRQSIVSPSAYVVRGYPDTMPHGLQLGLSAADLDALIAYLASLR